MIGQADTGPRALLLLAQEGPQPAPDEAVDPIEGGVMSLLEVAERDAVGAGYNSCLMASCEGLGWASHAARYYGTAFRSSVIELKKRFP